MILQSLYRTKKNKQPIKYADTGKMFPILPIYGYEQISIGNYPWPSACRLQNFVYNILLYVIEYPYGTIVLQGGKPPVLEIEGRCVRTGEYESFSVNSY